MFLKDPKSVPAGVRKNAPKEAAPAAPSKGGNDYTVTVNGKAYCVSLADGSATVNGAQYTVKVEDGIKAMPAPVAAPVAQNLGTQGGTPPPAVAPAPAPVAHAPQSGTPSGGTSVVAPLPGIILRLTVQNGAHVNAEQDIMVMESMKMEVAIKASCAGTVHLNVQQGTKINPGDVIATIS